MAIERNYLQAPLFVWWDITYACNLRCKQCYSNSGRPATNELNTEEAKALICELGKMKVFYIYFLGGEPLLRTDFFDLAEYARRCNIEVMMNTNGWFITEAVAAKLEKIGFMHVRVSLDGATPQVHDSIRGVKGSFEKAVNAIRILKKTSIHRIGISPTIFAENAKEVNNLIELAINLDVDEMQLVQLCRTGRGKNVQPLNNAQLEHIREIFNECRDKYKNRIDLSATEGISINNLFKKEDKKLPEFLGCTGGRTCAAIGADGRVQPCILYNVSTGNIRNNHFHGIWHHSPLFQKIRQVPKECMPCSFSLYCGGNCPIENQQGNLSQTYFVEKKFIERGR